MAARCASETGGAGVDRVVEVDLSANAGLDLQILRPGGEVVVYGSNAGEIPIPFVPAIVKMAGFRFFIVCNLAEDVGNAVLELAQA